MTNAEARFNKSLCPRKPEGSLGRTAQDSHLDSHTAPELSYLPKGREEMVRFVRIGPSNILFASVYVSTFPAGNFAGWGSEGVNSQFNDT